MKFLRSLWKSWWQSPKPEHPLPSIRPRFAFEESLIQRMNGGFFCAVKEARDRWESHGRAHIWCVGYRSQILYACHNESFVFVECTYDLDSRTNSGLILSHKAPIAREITSEQALQCLIDAEFAIPDWLSAKLEGLSSHGIKGGTKSPPSNQVVSALVVETGVTASLNDIPSPEPSASPEPPVVNPHEDRPMEFWGESGILPPAYYVETDDPDLREFITRFVLSAIEFLEELVTPECPGDRSVLTARAEILLRHLRKRWTFKLSRWSHLEVPVPHQATYREFQWPTDFQPIFQTMVRFEERIVLPLRVLAAIRLNGKSPELQPTASEVESAISVLLADRVELFALAQALRLQKREALAGSTAKPITSGIIPDAVVVALSVSTKEPPVVTAAPSEEPKPERAGDSTTEIPQDDLSWVPARRHTLVELEWKILRYLGEKGFDSLTRDCAYPTNSTLMTGLNFKSEKKLRETLSRLVQHGWIDNRCRHQKGFGYFLTPAGALVLTL